MNKFQEQWAIFLAAICEQTYAQFANSDGSFVVPINYSVRDTIQAKSAASNVWERFGFILESKSDIIIAFRGTSSTSNWISDAIATQEHFKYIRGNTLTHRGFTDIYASARGQIFSVLTKLSPNKTLYITGHSLGAALATLCTIDIAANTLHHFPYFFTYGSPRVGNPTFTKAFAMYVRNSYRIANEFDAVTVAPPRIYKLPKRDKKYYYSHVHTAIPLIFQNGSVSANHIISSYFAELSKLQPKYTQVLCSTNPGFCPVSKPKVKE